jgi:hypothetical protein
MNETRPDPVPLFTDEEFIAYLEEQGFWVEGLIREEPEAQTDDRT